MRSGEPDFATCPHQLSEDEQLRFIARSDASHAATSPPASTIRLRRDQTVHITPRHLGIVKNLENRVLIRKIDF